MSILNHHGGQKMRKIYIASSLANWSRVRSLWERLERYDISPTYDWTDHGKAIFEDGDAIIKEGIKSPEELGQIGWDELVGVLDAEYLLVVLPGERGTHVELGAYYGMHCIPDDPDPYDDKAEWGDFPKQPEEVPITILMGSDTAKRPTSFHHMKGIKRTECEEEAIDHILDHLGIDKDNMKG